MPRKGKRFGKIVRRSGRSFGKVMSKTAKISGSVASTALKALKVAQGVAALVNTEYKQIDVDGSPSCSTTGTLTLLTNVDEGDSRITRTGDVIRVKSNALNFYVIQNAAATTTQVMVALILDLAGNAGVDAPTMAKIYEDNGTSVNIISHRNLDYRTRFVILKDWHFTLDAAKGHSAVIKFYKNLDFRAHFAGADGDATYKANQLWLAVMSSEATNTPTLYFRNRVRFIDN